MPNISFSVSNSGYLKYRIYDSTNTYEEGSNLFLEYRNILKDAINKWDAIISPNVTYFNSPPYYYTHQVEIDIDVKDFAVDHDTQMDIFLTKYVYFGFPASYGLTFPTAGKFEIDIDFIAEVKAITISDDKSALYYLFLHGIGHILGIGTLWRANLVNDPLNKIMQDDGEDGYYYEKNSYAYEQYIQYYPIEGAGEYVGVPLENNGGEGTVNHHFEIGMSNNSFVSTNDRYVGGVLHNGINATEVMSVWTKDVTFPQYISKISAGILKDIGYEVNYEMTDAEYSSEGPAIEWLNIDFSNYPTIGTDVETTKTILKSIILATNKTSMNDPIVYDITIYGMTFSGADSNVLGQASWSTGEIWLNLANSGVYGLNGLDVSKNVAVMFHEILHVLGCVGVGEKGSQFINDNSTLPYNTYTGQNGVNRYRDVLDKNGKNVALYVEDIFPLEDDYGYGTETFHFEEDAHRHRWLNGIYYNTIKNEIMTGIMNGENFITSLTLGVLEDLGFMVNYESENVVDIHQDLIISEKPSITYLSQKDGNTVYAEISNFIMNEEQIDEYDNFVGLNVGKYYLTLAGTHSSWKYMGFHLPTSSSTSNKQEVFINNSYPGTTIKSTTTIGGLTYTFYSGEVEVTVTGDFGNMVLQDEYGSIRNIVFDRLSPRYERVSLPPSWSIFGVLDIKVELTLETNSQIKWIYKMSSIGAYSSEAVPDNYKVTTGGDVYWIESMSSNIINFSVDYTHYNEITYNTGTEISIVLVEGINHFGTLLKRFRLLDEIETSLADKNSLMKYNNVIQRFETVDYDSVLDNMTGYSIVAYSSGVIKAILS